MTAPVRFVLFVCLAAAALPAAPVPPLLPNAELIARAPLLSIDERRQLVYLYARLNQPKLAELLGEQILSSNPSDRQTLLVLASMYLEQKDAAATLRIARRYLQFFPGDHQGLYFLGSGHYLAREFAEAERILRDLKHSQFAGQRYPYETDLAASANAAGQWYRAMLSYQDLLRHHTLADELRSEVRTALDGIYREHLPRIEATAAATGLDRARVWRYGVAQARHLSDRHWLDTRFARDDVELDDAPGLRAARLDRAEAAATLTTVHDRRWRTEVSVGAGREGLLAGARARFKLGDPGDLTLEVAFNERATDSLVLEALDGRQHRAALVLNWLLHADLALVGRVQAREVAVGGARLGRGAGIDLNLDQTLRRQHPRLIAGYRGTLARFEAADPATLPAGIVAPVSDPLGGPAARTAVLANLISPRLNRHGTGLVVADQFTTAWAYRLTAGADYDFQLAASGWNAGLALSFYPRKSIELTLEGGYTSNASGSNAGSAATLLNLFLRTYY